MTSAFSRPDGDLRVAYILFRFPSLTETFITQEILKVRAAGIDVRIYSLLPPKVKGDPAGLEVKNAPGVGHPGLWWAQVTRAFRQPWQYLRLLFLALGAPRSRPAFMLKRLAIFLKSAWLANELEGSGVRLLHTHFAWLPGLSARLVSQFLGLPYTVTAHAFDIFAQTDNLLELAAAEASSILTISQANQSAIRAASPRLSGQRIEVVRCGVDLEVFQFFHRQAARAPLRIISVGSLIEKKGHEYLIRACSILKQRDLPFECQVIGAGELEQPLRDLISSLGLQAHVRLAGSQASAWVREQLEQSDIFALACVVSREGDRDGIPVALMEAMAVGLPVISTPVSGITELVEHEHTGLLVPERDAPALADALARCMADGNLLRGLAIAARRRVELEYDLTRNAACLAGVFRELAAK